MSDKKKLTNHKTALDASQLFKAETQKNPNEEPSQNQSDRNSIQSEALLPKPSIIYETQGHEI